MVERTSWRFDVRSGLLTLLAVGLCGFGYRLWKRPPPKPPTVQERIAADLDRISRLKIGMEGTLSDPVRGNVAIGRTREDYDAVVEAQDSGDDIGLREIIVSGRGFKATNGNRAELQEKDPFGALKLRFLGGDHTDEVGWASGEYFH